jgi:hypothetical protein
VRKPERQRQAPGFPRFAGASGGQNVSTDLQRKKSEAATACILKAAGDKERDELLLLLATLQLDPYGKIVALRSLLAAMGIISQAEFDECSSRISEGAIRLTRDDFDSQLLDFLRQFEGLKQRPM